MYAKKTRPSAKREVQKERSAKRDDQTAPFFSHTFQFSFIQIVKMK